MEEYRHVFPIYEAFSHTPCLHRPKTRAAKRDVACLPVASCSINVAARPSNVIVTGWGRIPLCPEWHQLRIFLYTSSVSHSLFADILNDKFSLARDDYEQMLEKFTGELYFMKAGSRRRRATEFYRASLTCGVTGFCLASGPRGIWKRSFSQAPDFYLHILWENISCCLAEKQYDFDATWWFLKTESYLSHTAALARIHPSHSLMAHR